MMIKTLIIEDEYAAVENLSFLLNQSSFQFDIQATIDSVKAAIQYLEQAPELDLIFMDIHLADGLSFDIFKHVKVKTPIIFTTAYDEYTLQAFKVNSVDYLLKPINPRELEAALQKHQEQQNQQVQNQLLNQLQQHFSRSQASNVQTLLVYQGESMLPLSVADIAYIFIEAGIVKARNFSNQSFFLDKKLEDFEQMLSSKNFFRANRQFIVNRKAIHKMDQHFNGKLSLHLQPNTKEKILMSRAKVKAFKEWLMLG